MRTVVLLKPVPDRSTLEVDPNSRWLRRPAGRLFVNPFDQRALRLALDLRRPNDEVVTLSMAPESAIGPLEEALAFGLDRSLLITGPDLQGADLLRTARTLADALRSLDPDLLLTGVRSTDSGCGVLPALLAELLDWPLAGPARRIERGAAGEELVVTIETEGGWAKGPVGLPSVISAGEKVATLRPATDEERARSIERTVERWPRTAHPSSAAGSDPNAAQLLDLEAVTLPRDPRRFDSGTSEERAARAAEWAIERSTLRSRARRAATDLSEPRSSGSIVALVSSSDGRL